MLIKGDPQRIMSSVYSSLIKIIRPLLLVAYAPMTAPTPSFLMPLRQLQHLNRSGRLPYFNIFNFAPLFLRMLSCKKPYAKYFIQKLSNMFDIQILVESDQNPVKVPPHTGAKCLNRVPRMILCLSILISCAPSMGENFAQLFKS